jgi:hypothetical protein
MPSGMSEAPSPAPTRRSPLRGLAIAGRGVASEYALALLSSLGVPARSEPGAPDPDPDEAWARSGAMALTGLAGGAPLAVDAPVASCADGAARAFSALARALLGHAPEDLDGGALLGERAALATPVLTRAGARSPGGAAHLLRCRDGWLALNLSRPDDEALLPAWLEAPRPAAGSAADFAASAVAGRARGPLVARGRLMGLAVAALPGRGDRVPGGRWLRAERLGERANAPIAPPLVVDLSSLWAGPLCGQLLAACGARVVKVESLERPDGARSGSPAFFDLLNGSKSSVALSLGSAGGRRALDALLRGADIVIESSRPRALRHMGIDARAIVRDHGTTWVSITGYGRRDPEEAWAAFGDDAAVSAGLVASVPGTPDAAPCFCGDAIADPLTGLHAALAALASHGGRGGQLLDVSLAGVAACVGRFPNGGPRARREIAAQPPRARAVRERAPGLGRDTGSVLAQLGVRC